MHRSRFAVLALLAAAALAACSGEATTATVVDPTGTYLLAEVDGKALPAKACTGNGTGYLVKSGTLDIRADGTFSFANTVDEPEVGFRVLFNGDGTYVRSGSTITLTRTFFEPAVIRGTVRQGSVTLDIPFPGCTGTYAHRYTR
jgi:hypothetical protein